MIPSCPIIQTGLVLPVARPTIKPNGVASPLFVPLHHSSTATGGMALTQRHQWFLPDDGIVREVITADIQKYLGPDALVRPGIGTGEYEGKTGYWITANHSLTANMIADLQLDSQRSEMDSLGKVDQCRLGKDTFGAAIVAGVWERISC